MKNENILNNSVSDTKIEEVKGSINDNLDSIGILIEKIEAFNQLINLKLDEVKEPPTKPYKNNSTIDNMAIDIFTMQSNINNYIMLSYSISDYTTRINTLLNDIHDKLKQLD